MKKILLLCCILLLVINGTVWAEEMISGNNLLKGKIICVDPGHGGTAGKDMFRQGPTGEREEWINLRVAFLLKELLEEAGASVILTRTKDIFVELKDRADTAIKGKADLFISIHHNGTDQDPEVNFPIVFYYKDATQNPASVDFANILVRHFQTVLGLPEGYPFSDWTIYPNSGTAVLRHTFPHMPGVIGEASFFTNADEENRLKNEDYNRKEAQAYFDTIVKYYQKGIPVVYMIEPAPGNPLSDTKAQLRFQLNSGIKGVEIDPNSIRVNWNGKYIGKSFNGKDGIVSIFPTEFSYGDQTLKLYFRNMNKQAIHPQTFIFKTSGDLRKALNEQKKNRVESSEPVLRVKLLEPQQGTVLNENEPRIVLAMEDNNIAKSLDLSSFEIYLNHRKVNYEYHIIKHQVIINGDDLLRTGSQVIHFVLAKDTTGLVYQIEPTQFSFRRSPSSISMEKEWFTSFEKGADIVEEIVEDTTGNELSNEEKEILLKGIDYLQRSLEVFPDSQVSGKAQYLIGLGFEQMVKDPYYKELAVTAYTRAVEYFPSFPTTENARVALDRLVSPEIAEPESE